MKQFIFSVVHMGIVQIVTLGGFLLGVFYFSLYNDGSLVKKQTAEIQTQTQAMDKKIQEQRKEIEERMDFKQLVEREGRVIQYFLSYIPNDYTAIDIFHFLTQEAKNAGINIEDKSDQGVESGEFYDALKVSIRVAGSFSQVLLFLSRLTAQKKILVVDKISMSLSNEDDQGILATMIVYAYRYKEDEEKEEGKEG